MHSTSSYDAQSKRYAIFKMPTQCRVCEKQRKRGTEFWQVLDMVCVDDNGDPHVNKEEAKILEIFSLNRWNRTRAEQLLGNVTWPLG